MTAAKAKKTSPLAEFFCNATEQKKRDMYALLISKATASQLQVEAKAEEIKARQAKASA
ncbi:MAG: hypothetical protein JWQ69_5260 [Pseudomonas sp.]|nr:hypothetical protein [Pseudomonas sp.]